MTEDILSKPYTQVFTGSSDDPSIPQLLELIGKMTPRVNAVTDQANQLIRSVEASLSNWGVGVDAVVDVDANALVTTYHFESHASDEWTEEKRESRGPTKELSLWYGRDGGGFRIVVVEHCLWRGDDDQQSETIFLKPLLECPRDKKLFAVHFLGELLFEVARSMQSLAAITESVLTSATLTRDIETMAKLEAEKEAHRAAVKRSGKDDMMRSIGNSVGAAVRAAANTVGNLGGEAIYTGPGTEADALEAGKAKAISGKNDIYRRAAQQAVNARAKQK